MSLRHYLVSGRVQGVGFRRFVEKQAQHYGVSGVVRNLEDGRVECLAQGSEEDLQEFERAVRRGPMLSAVREVVSRAVASKTEIETDWTTGLFSIAVDGERPWIGEE
jgi:acylphosphatase